ncbi:MAG: protease modulator HflC [Lachnospiraceae bacterium]|jgi:membrane protease subunit HflC|nr:protease modulator HflC [Lachnospiraceae bacterium]
MKKNIAMAVVVAVVVFAIIVAAQMAVVTRQNEYKLIRQFGRIERVISEPGLSFKTPFIQSADSVPKEILLYDLASSDVITMDKKTMQTDSFVLWRITDPVKFAQTLDGNVLNAERRIDTVVYNSIKNIIGSIDQNDLISKRDEDLSQEILRNIGTNMDQYGIAFLAVETKRLDLPTDNKQAVYDRMISERAKIAATYTAEGEAEAQKIRNQTDREVAVSISNAQAQAAQVTAEGEAEYMRILAEAYNSPERAEFYGFVRSLEAARNSLSGTGNTLILPADSPLAKIFVE